MVNLQCDVLHFRLIAFLVENFYQLNPTWFLLSEWEGKN